MAENIVSPVANYEVDRMAQIKALEDISDFVRRDGFEMVQAAQSGHPGGSSSSTELLVSLYFGGKFKFDIDNPANPNRDRVLIRGHEGPARYPIFSLMGHLDRSELTSYRQPDSRLQGHEDMHLTPGVDITPSGSLGMILSYGVGAATTLKNEGNPGRTIVFLGDGEEQEGNVSEAARHASTLGLDNLICILDKNKKQLSRPTSSSDGGSDVRTIWQGYGWDVLEIEDGNDIEEIMGVYDQLQNISRPTFVIANTVKGKGIDGAEDHYNGYHSMSTTDADGLDRAIAAINTKLENSGAEKSVPENARRLVARPQGIGKLAVNRHVDIDIVPIEEGRQGLSASQNEYFSALREKLQSDPAFKLYTITPDMIREPDAAVFEKLGHFYDSGLREQHAVAMAHGISTTDPNARVNLSFGDPFIFRALDQINAAVNGGSSILLVGEHSGMDGGQDGKTHQSDVQPEVLMQLPHIKMYEPADVKDLFNVLNSTLSTNQGFTYVRLHKKTVGVLNREEKDRTNIESYITHDSDATPELVIVTSGLTVENSVLAAQKLELEEDKKIRVVNLVSPKDLTEDFLKHLVDGVPVLAVYNGHPDALQAQISRLVMEAPTIMPSKVKGHGFSAKTSGRLVELEKYYNLDPVGIANEVLSILND